MKVLAIDFGNTRSKWKVFSDEPISGVFESSLPSEDELKKFIGKVDHVVCASVRGGSFNDTFTEYCLSVMPVSPIFLSVEKNFGALSNGYENIHKLGVDRWLAMVSGWRYVQNEFVAIDFGTAVTVDVVDKHGQHCGGYIVPGLGSLVAGLNTGTRLIDVDAGVGESVELGLNTAAAVNGGCTQMLAAFVESECLKHSEAKILLTGGGAQSIIKHLSSRVEYLPDMVLDGIFLAAAPSSK